MVELDFLIVAIDQANLSISDNVHALHCLLVNQNYAVVGAIRDDHHVVRQVFLSLNADDLTWVA